MNATPQLDADSTPAAAPPAGAGQGSRKSLNVLVAEDGLVNQKVLRRMLEKAGHTVHLAANGREAVEAFDARPFDVVLMDVQMPEMDGFEATALIRARDREAGRHTPVFGVTAHADRDSCLAAGMDGHLAKPIRAADLFCALEGVLPATAPGLESAATGSAVLDGAAVLYRVGGDRELLRELVTLFFEDCPRWLVEIRASISRRNARDLKAAAHLLYGTVSNFSAPAAIAAARRLEVMGRAGDLAGAEDACAALVASIDELRPALTALIEEKP